MEFKSQEVERITYIRWHGENNKSTTPEPISVNKTPTNGGRYFHVNFENDSNQATKIEIKKIEQVTTSNFVETPEFIKRKTTLLSRIFRSKNENQDQNLDETLKTSKETDNNEIKFFDDFIPLDSNPEPAVEEIKPTKSSPSEKSSVYDPQSDGFEYDGPYVFDQLIKARKKLIESLRPLNKTQYADRTLEILKIKLKIPSRFDNDKRLLSRLKSKQQDYLMQINQKIRLAQKLSLKNLKNNFNDKKMNQPKNNHVYLNTDSDDAASFVSDYSFDKNEKVNEKKGDQDKFLFNYNSNVFNKLFDDDKKDKKKSVDESNEMNLIIGSSEDDDEEAEGQVVDDEDEEEDSKCRQFDKYKKKGPKSKLLNNIQNEIVELEEGYRKVRDERNKLMKNIKRKKKKGKILPKNENGDGLGNDLNVKREMLNKEMATIRKNIKKLRKTSRTESRRNYKQRKKKNNY